MMIEWQSEPRSFTVGLAANGAVGSTFNGWMERVIVRDLDGVRVGTAHTIAYVRLSETPATPRPVTFVFNGGPGVSSVWLHIGGVGPYRVAVPEDLTRGILPPYELEENAGSLLADTDLIFIDPIRTGFGRVDQGVDQSLASAATDGAEADAEHVAQMIEGWLRRHNRFGAPVYLVGESYGTVRAALLATRLLQRDTAIAVRGIALLGQAVNAQETTQRPGNPIGYVAAIPFLAVTAKYHGRGAYLDLPVEELADQAHEWSITRYASALLQGDRLPDEEAKRVARELSDFCGLDPKVLLERRLRVNKEDFRRELVPGKILGLTDSRYMLPRAQVGLAEPEFEPTGLHLDSAYAALIHRTLVERLGVDSEEPYRLADSGTHERWNYQEAGARGAFGGSPLPSPFAIYDYAANLRAWMRANHQARLFIGTGHYDSLTTVGAAYNLLAQNDLPRERVTFHTYEGGHMMYSDRVSAQKLGADLRAFVRGEAA